ncbi:Ger(x)C family spore germination protein [Sporosarcina sp. UB5]|uniref:Ger(x)C family spore germination protein n=1 Tax=Sporosarcina sp. UB5 TaxID=3047463 RepID=UPI003D79F268
MASKQKRIKGYISSTLLLVMLLQAGCSFKDIDKRMFVVGIGIDPSEKVNDGFKVTLKLAKPIGNVKQETTPTYVYLSNDSKSVADAVQIMENRSDKVLDFGHSRIIVLNKEILSKKPEAYMDFFTRRGDIQMVSYVAAAENTSEEILSFEPQLETPASIALYNYFDNTGTESGYILTTFLFEFRRALLGSGINTIIPIIGIDKENEEYKVDKSTIIRVGEKPFELTAEETKLFNTLENRTIGYTYKMEVEDHIMVLNFKQSKMNYNLIANEGNPRIDMNVTNVGVIAESNKRLNNNDLHKYNQMTKKDLETKIVDLLTKFQENDVDPFGFGLRYRATRLSRKGIMDEWKSIYPEIKFNVKVNVELQGTGPIE